MKCKVIANDDRVIFAKDLEDYLEHLDSYTIQYKPIPLDHQVVDTALGITPLQVRRYIH